MTYEEERARADAWAAQEAAYWRSIALIWAKCIVAVAGIAAATIVTCKLGGS